jgi:hypothetical protein
MNESEKNGGRDRLGVFIIANAIVWGAAIIGVSIILRGSGHMKVVAPVLGGCASFSVVILPVILKKKKER